MSSQDEISSTEKLLDLIRSPNGEGPEAPAQNPVDLSSRKGRHGPLRLLWPSRKRVIVGIDFGFRDLKVVKTARSATGEWQLLDYVGIPYDPGTALGSAELKRILKHSLQEFCSPERSCELWAMLSSSRVEVHPIRIPRVPKKQVGNAVYWTYKKEASFEEERDVLDFSVLGDSVEDGIPKTSVMVFTAPREEVRVLKHLFIDVGFPLTGISLASFAIQNLLKTSVLGNGGGTVGCLYLGGDWSRVDIFSRGNLILARGIKAGMNSLIDALLEGLRETRQGDSRAVTEGEDDAGRGTLEIGPADMKEARKILFSIGLEGSPGASTSQHLWLSEEEIRDTIQPALERLVRRIERSVEHHALMLEEGNIRKFYVAGEVYAHRRLDAYISEQIGIPTQLVDPFSTGTPLLQELSSPDSPVERASYAAALGMALSDGARTPNLLFTYQDREKQARMSCLNRVILTVSAILAVLCVVTFLWMGHTEKGIRIRAANLKRELGKTQPLLTRDSITQLAARAMENQRIMKTYGEKYRAMAVIGELSRLTPPNIRLLNLQARLTPKVGEKGQKEPQELVLEGVATGEPQKLAGVLATYLLRLEGSPLFNQSGKPKTDVVEQEGKQVLRFSVSVAMASPQGKQRAAGKGGKNS